MSVPDDDAPVPSTAARVRAAALAVPGVATLTAGRFGEIATYLPGGRVPGVRIDDDGVHVHVVVTATGVRDLPGVAGAVHEAVRSVLRTVPDEAQDDAPPAPTTPTTPVVVHVDDVEAPGRPGGAEVPHDGTRKDES
ncbi:hypothetical protein ACH436_18625 [Isoptericola sp. NPDC019693]|uniref:hypothetical protein n=1 Tax=Isoptericola sp. NPDC019693 TaxID=3364009 RepID=UPI0037AA5ABB